MFVELHILQNFAPSNLNRDDTGSPKDCEFGGVRRARISSQCLKRSIRRSDEFRRVVSGYDAVRTRRLIVEVAKRLSGKDPAPESTTKVIAEVFKEAGLERPEQRATTPRNASGNQSDTAATATDTAEKDNTKLLLFMDARSIDQAVAVFRSRWESLTRGDRDHRNAAISELGSILTASARVPDVALFGRMIEMNDDKPFGKLQLGIEAASQVAHAISTHKVGVEFDFYTAVDDLQPRGETGAGMMGTVEFNSACFYRYANVDVAQLRSNLGSDDALAQRALEAFIRASIAAIPTGKQNSMAAQNPPSLVMSVVRERGLWSLANAFARPVRATEREDLITGSISALFTQWAKLKRMYGKTGIVGAWVLEEEGVPLPDTDTQRVASEDELVAHTLAALRAGVVA